jgi:hypothetical protein
MGRWYKNCMDTQVCSVFRAISFSVYFFSFGSSIAKLQRGPFFVRQLVGITVSSEDDFVWCAN